MSTEHEDFIKYYALRAQKCEIPVYMIPGLTRYLVDRIAPGDFLMAVLENDLMRALGTADDTNINCLKAYGTFLYNYAPAVCHGSREKVSAWLEGRQS